MDTSPPELKNGVPFTRSFDDAPVGMSYTALDGRYLRVNKKLCEITGYTQDELLSLEFQTITHPDDVISDHHKHQQALAGLIKTFRLDKRYIRKDGSLIWVNITVTLIRDELGQPLYSFGVVEDSLTRERPQVQRQDVTIGLRKVLAATNQLMACPTTDSMLKLAVEFARSTLGLERCAIFFQRDGYIQGTYGTDSEGNTTDEHKIRVNLSDQWPQQVAQLTPDSAQWLMVENRKHTEWDGEHIKVVGTGWVVITLIPIADGRKGYLFNDTHISNAPIDETQQEIVAVFCSLLGKMIERRQVEEALHESETRLQQAVRAANIGIFEHDHLTNTIFWSPVQRQIFGWETTENVGLQDSLARIHADDRARIESAIHRAHDPAGDGVYDVEYRLMAHDGSLRWLSVHSLTSFEGEGEYRRPVRTIGATADITARRGAEDALRESEQMLRNILNNIPVRVFWKDLTLRLLGCNQHFADDMGVASPTDLIGKTTEDLIHEQTPQWIDQSAQFDLDDRRVLDTGEPMLGYEEQQMRSDHNLYWVRTSKLPMCNADGKIIGLLCTYEDITSRKITEVALQKKREEEQELQTYLKLLHEINIELNMIDSLDDFYRSIVELGLTRLGFDRMSLWLYDSEHGLANGTYGTDDRGVIQRESHMQFRLEPHGGFWQSMQKPDRFVYEESRDLTHNFEGVGTGWSVAIALWQGNRNLGWLSVDNLINQRPISQPQLDILAQYGMQIGTMLARKQVQEALRESEIFLRRSQTVGRIGSYYFNIDTGNWLGSPVLEELFGIDAQYPKTLAALLPLVHPAQRDELRHALDRDVLIASRHFDKEIRIIRHNDGQECWMHGLGELEFDDQNHVVRLIGTVQDISARKQVENALRASEQMLQNVLNTIPVRVFWKDVNLRLSGCNKAFLSDAQADSPEQLIGKSDEELLPDSTLLEQANKYYSDDRRVLETGVPLMSYEEAQVRLDGKQYWLRTSKVPLRDIDGNIIGVLGTYEDITQRKYIDERLRESEQRLLEAQRLAHVGHWDSYHNVLTWSDETYRIFGLQPQQEVMRIDKILEYVHPDDRDDFNQTLSRSIQRAESFENEFRIIRPDGSVRYVHGTGNLSFDEHGSLSRMFGTMMDITERRLNQEALQRANQRLSLLREIDHRILVAHSPVTLASNVLHQLVNLIACDWAGIVLYSEDLTEEHVYAIQYSSGVTVETSTAYPLIHNRAFERQMRGQTAMADDLATVDGPLTYLAQELMQQGVHGVMANPLMAQGRLIGILALASKQVGFFTTEHQQIGEDIAAQIAIALHQASLNEQIARHNAELEQRVRERTAELQQVNDEIKNFAYIVSHDLRAPLVNLKGFAAELRISLNEVEALCSEVVPVLPVEKAAKLTTVLHTDIPESLHFIDSSASQMDGFTKAILKLSRLGRSNLELIEVDTRSVVDKILTSLGYQINQAGITLHIDPLPTIITDYLSLEQIFGNILTNAVTYLDPQRPGEIWISGEVTDKETSFRIRDNGQGIAKEDMDKVFAPFRRAGKHTTPGEGMGMAYVQALVRRHGGQIWCESELGVGTIFTFTIARQVTKEARL